MSVEMADRTFNVLLVEDDPDDVVIARKLLARAQLSRYKIDWASSYGEGLERLSTSAYDICLCDYRLGERNGIDLLREAVARGVQAPFILLTGQNDTTIDFAAEQAGVSDYLVKGEFTLAIIERSIRYTIQRSRDQAEMKKARDAALEATRIKSEFLSHVSHELRSPVAAIHQFTTILLDGLSGEVNAEQRDHLSIILRNSRHLSSMIEDLLAATRNRGAVLTASPRSIDLARLVEDTVRVLAGGAQASRFSWLANRAEYYRAPGLIRIGRDRSWST